MLLGLQRLFDPIFELLDLGLLDMVLVLVVMLLGLELFILFLEFLKRYSHSSLGHLHLRGVFCLFHPVVLLQSDALQLGLNGLALVAPVGDLSLELAGTLLAEVDHFERRRVEAHRRLRRFFSLPPGGIALLR